jgi:RimJ/RimL family protein N-acetyltransferase
MMPKDLLRGERVRLMALMSDDVSVIARWDHDGTFLRLFDGRPAYPRTETALAEWLAGQQKSANDFTFAVRPLEEDRLLGYIELDGVLWSHQVCGIAYCIGEPADRGQGYGREAVSLALAFAFHELNLHRVTLTVFNYNQPSIALAEKLGFQREGVFREFLQRDGQRHDMFLYGLLRHEWEGLHAS